MAFGRKRKKGTNYWLGLILRVLLITVALFKIVDFMYPNTIKNMFTKTPTPIEADSSAISNSFSRRPDGTTDEFSKKDMDNPNESELGTASVYIFGENGLDIQMSTMVAKSYFGDYKIKTGSNVHENQMLTGDLSSAAPTELVCVGKVVYSYIDNGADMGITCELSLNFNTYRKASELLVEHLSESMVIPGLGFSQSQAKLAAQKKMASQSIL